MKVIQEQAPGGPEVLIQNGAYKWMSPLPAMHGNQVAGTIDAPGAGITYRPQRRGLMEQAWSLMASGRVRAPRTLRFPLAQARDVHELLESGQTLGKIVLYP